MLVDASFFDQDPAALAVGLLGKVLRRRIRLLSTRQNVDCWLSAQIIETEAYYVTERGSHSSLGMTDARKAMFMSPGTIYMYHSRAGDSLNVSTRGDGDAVLIKAAAPFFDARSPEADALPVMQRLNPTRSGRPRG